MRRIMMLGCVIAFAATAAFAATEKTTEKTKAEAKPLLQPVCPPAIKTKKEALAEAIKDWSSFADEEAAPKLDTVSLYTYTQKKTMSKLGASKGTESFTEWQLPDNGKEKYYVVCSYTRSSLLLKQMLDARFKRCRLTFQTNPATPALPAQLHTITCD